MELVDIPVANYGSPSFLGNAVTGLGVVGANVIAEREEIEQIQQLLLLGKQSLEEHNYAAAIKLFTEALEIDNTNPSLLIARARAFSKNKDFENALDDAATLLQSSKNEKSIQTDALLLFVEIHKANNNLDIALEYALKLLLQDPHESDIRVLVNDTCDLIVDNKTSDERLVSEASFFDNLQSIAANLLKSNRLVSAQRIIECLIHLEAIVPPDVLTRSLLIGAQILAKQKNWERAIATYQECVLRAWKSEFLILESEARIELGAVYYELKDFFQAASSYEKYLCLLEIFEARSKSEENLQRNPSDNHEMALQKIEALYRISNCYLNLNELEMAESQARAIAREIEQCSQRTGRRESHEARLSSATCREKELLCKIMTRKRNFVEAEKYAKQFLDCSKEAKQHLLQAYILCGSVHCKTGSFAVSLGFYNEALSLCLREVELANSAKSESIERLCKTLYCLGKLNFKLGDCKSAIKYLDDCLKQSRRVGENRDLECKTFTYLGKAFGSLKESAQAIHSFNSGLDLQAEVSAKVHRRCLAESVIAIQDVGSASELEKARCDVELLLADFQEQALNEFIKNGDFNGKRCVIFEDISNAYINLLTKLGHVQAALLACESLRRFKFVSFFHLKSELIGGKSEIYRKVLDNKLTIEYFVACLKRQEHPIMYLHLSKRALFVWLLSASNGVQSFHKHTLESSERSMFEMLEMYYCAFASRNSGLYGYENRIIVNSQKLVSTLPKLDANEIEKALDKDLIHYVFEPLKTELRKVSVKARKLIIIHDGLLGLVPYLDVFKSFWKQSFSSECPPLEFFTSVQMMHWTLYSMSEALSEPITLSSGAKLEPRKNTRKESDALSFSRGGATANLLGWSDLSEGLGAEGGLKEVPFLQYQRQIQSAGGEKTDYTSLYRAINPNMDRITSEQNMGVGGAVGMDNESLRTDASSVKQQQSVSSGKAARKGATKSSNVPPNVVKGTSSGSQASQRESDNISVSLISSEESKGSCKVDTYKKIEQSFTSLVSKTWNGKQVRCSDLAVEHYLPDGKNKQFRFLGAPIMPTTVQFPGITWKPLRCLRFAQEELKTCAGYFRTCPDMGEKCTKNEALRVLMHCSCVHIATYINYDTCCLAFSPNQVYQKMKSVDAEVCCVETRDLLDLNLSHIQLLVLSAFPSQKHENNDSFWNLITLLLALGVNCIVFSTQAVKTESVAKFWHYFYRAIRKIEPSCRVSEALGYAKSHMQKDAKFASFENWKSFQFVGADIVVDGKALIHDMLDDVIDKVEKLDKKDYFNMSQPSTYENTVSSAVESMQELRKLLADLIMSNITTLDILDSLFQLSLIGLEHCSQPGSDLVRVEDSRILDNRESLVLLHFLRFDFQPYGCTSNKEDVLHPVIVFPHWDKNALLRPACDALRNLVFIKDNPKVLEELASVLYASCGKSQEPLVADPEISPDHSDMLSLLIDVLSLAEHAPDLQMFISDSGVRKVWQCAPSRRLLTAVGFHQVEAALLPYRNLTNSRCQQATLRILCALSGVKGEAMVGRLDTNYLGTADVNRTISSIQQGPITAENTLNSAQGVPGTTKAVGGSMQAENTSVNENMMLWGPTGHLCMPVQWKISHKDLTAEEVARLASQIRGVRLDYKMQLKAFLNQHQAQLQLHAKKHLEETFGIVPERADKVKVQPGGTPSTTLRPQLIPYQSEVPTLEQVQAEREYSHYVLQWRVSDVKNYMDNDIRSLIMHKSSKIA